MHYSMNETTHDAITNERPEVKPSRNPTRRHFIEVLGAGSAVTLGLSSSATAEQPAVVSMHNNNFDPIGLYVEPGTTVRFEIEEGSHSATAYADRLPADAAPFDSGVLSQGEFEHTFEVPGTYDYYCIPHKSMGMVGRIVVGSPGGPAERNPIPDGAVPGSERIVQEGTVSAGDFDDPPGGGGGMMGGGPGMMGERGSGWMMLMPLGFVTALAGVVGGIAYLAGRQGGQPSTTHDPAVATLRERYARGEIDEDEYRERRRRLEQDGQPGY